MRKLYVLLLLIFCTSFQLNAQWKHTLDNFRTVSNFAECRNYIFAGTEGWGVFRSSYNDDIETERNKDLQSATLPEQKEQLQARISYTDKKIDQIVYQLYELTEEEIKIVEGE